MFIEKYGKCCRPFKSGWCYLKSNLRHERHTKNELTKPTPDEISICKLNTKRIDLYFRKHFGWRCSIVCTVVELIFIFCSYCCYCFLDILNNAYSIHIFTLFFYCPLHLFPLVVSLAIFHRLTMRY